MANTIAAKKLSSDNLIFSLSEYVDQKLTEKNHDRLRVLDFVRKLFSSKQRPSPFIRYLLNLYQETEEYPIILQETCQKIITEHFNMISTRRPCTTSIKKVSISIFCIQLALESVSMVSEKISIEMAISIIQALQNVLSRKLTEQGAEDELSDDNICVLNHVGSHANTLVIFCVGSLLRAVNQYTSTFPVLLSPLWKNICAFVSKTPHMPAELIDSMIATLMVYLKEGEKTCLSSGSDIAENQEQNTESTQQFLFHNKILSFLLARLTVLLPFHVSISLNETCEHKLSVTLEDILTLLFRIYGLASAVEITAQSKVSKKNMQQSILSYRNLGKKVDQCITSTLIKDGALDRKVAMALLRTKCSNSTGSDFEVCCWKFGKMGLFFAVLEQAPMISRNAELLVMIVEQIIFSLFPQCYRAKLQPQVTNQFLSIATHATLALAASSQVRLVHSILLEWLHRCAYHAVSRELVVSLVYNHIIGLESHESPISTKRKNTFTATPLITMLVSVFLDCRTQSKHRETIGSLLSRLLVTRTCTISSSLSRHQLSTQILSFSDRLHQETRNRRKRTNSALPLSDWVCILNIIQLLDFNLKNSLQLAVTTFVDDIQKNRASKRGNNIFHHGNRTPLHIATILCGTAQQQTFPLQILRWFLNQTKKRKTSNILTRGVVVLTISLLNSLSQSYSVTSTNDSMKLASKILIWTVKEAQKLISSFHEDAGITLALSSASFLGKIGTGITCSTPDDTIDEIVYSFNALSKMHNWIVIARMMTSLIYFASTLQVRQEMLTKCLPISMKDYFKCRLKGKVYCSCSKSEFDSTQGELVEELCSKLNTDFHTVKKSLFEKLSINILAKGSYLISMPTMEGRNAIVIFPPTDQSLIDIKYMLQEENLDNANVRQLNYASALKNGAGCQLFSSKSN